MSSLRKAAVRLAYEHPEVRAQLLPLLKQAAGMTLPADAQSFAESIDRLAKKAFPEGTSGWRADRSWGNKPVGTLYFHMTTTGKADWANGIYENDPSYNTFWIHEAFTAEGLLPVMKIEISQGGDVCGPNASHCTKVGWRNKTGTPDQILKHVQAYYTKLRLVFDAHRSQFNW